LVLLKKVSIGRFDNGIPNLDDQLNWFQIISN
jgi:hypothetical protein